MEQRRLRLGDILDDYCPRERRLTNHAVVAMIDDTVKQTRCTTCDAEHVYKGGKVPRRRKQETPAALYKEVLAGMPETESRPCWPSGTSRRRHRTKRRSSRPPRPSISSTRPNPRRRVRLSPTFRSHRWRQKRHRTLRRTTAIASRRGPSIVRSFARSFRASRGTRKSAGCPSSRFARPGVPGDSAVVTCAPRAAPVHRVTTATAQTAIGPTADPGLPARAPGRQGAASRAAAVRRADSAVDPVSHGRAVPRSALADGAAPAATPPLEHRHPTRRAASRRRYAGSSAALRKPSAALS